MLVEELISKLNFFICIRFQSLFSRITCTEDLISPTQFKLKRLFISRYIYKCGKFIVRLNEKCFSLPLDVLYELECLLKNAARDLHWILKGVLHYSDRCLPHRIIVKNYPQRIQYLCLWVMELSELVTKHLLDFQIRAFNRCWLLISLKSTCKHWVFRCAEASKVFNI